MGGKIVAIFLGSVSIIVGLYVTWLIYTDVNEDYKNQKNEIKLEITLVGYEDAKVHDSETGRDYDGYRGVYIGYINGEPHYYKGGYTSQYKQHIADKMVVYVDRETLQHWHPAYKWYSKFKCLFGLLFVAAGGFIVFAGIKQEYIPLYVNGRLVGRRDDEEHGW